MSSSNYNDKIVVAALNKCSSASWFAYAEALGALRDASAEGTGASRVYGLLHDICMSPIREDVVNESAPLPGDDILALIEVESKISNSRLRAIVLDYIWTFGKKIAGKDSHVFAAEAVKCYSSIDIVERDWIRDGQDECLERALRISLALGKAGTDKLLSVKQKLAEAYANGVANDESSHFLFWIPRLLMKVGIKDAISPKVIIENFLRFATEKESGYREFDVQMALLEAISWCDFSGDRDSMAAARQRLAKSYQREADLESGKVGVSWLRAAHFYDLAHAELLKIEGNHRGDDFSGELFEVEQKSDAAYQHAMSQMQRIRIPDIDMSHEAKKAELFVKGVEAERALRRLCLMLPLEEKDAEAYADGILKGGALASLFGKTVIGSGAKPRVVGYVPALSQDPGEYSKRYWCEKVGGANAIVGMYVRSRLYPAYCAIRKEHDLDLEFFRALVDKAPLIPSNHKRTYAEAIWLGYSGKFTLATYVLAPEIENIVRSVLNGANVCTTSVHDCVLQENGLSQLVKEKKLVELFSADFVFVLRAVFTDHLGPNVRNEVAHGLKDDTVFNSCVDFYVWWFALSLGFYGKEERSAQ